MRRNSNARPVIVGIDGSKAALRSAIWAAEEAAAHDAPLRLTYVVGRKKNTKKMNTRYDRAYGSLHRAWTAVEATGLPVKLEIDVLEGDPAEQLASVSQHAEMVCVGWKGRHDSGEHMRGYVAVELARTAFSKVTIVRSHTISRASTPTGRIVAMLDDSTASHAVLETAVGEALLRHASVLALTPWSMERHDLDGTETGSVRAELKQLLDGNDPDGSDVLISTTLPPADLLETLVQGGDADQLVVVSKSRPDLLEELSNSRARDLLRNTNCSILVLHDPVSD